jgi:hypothetical protein
MSTEGETFQVSVLIYRCLICPPFVGECKQRERHFKFLSYLTSAWYFNPLWEHVNRKRDIPSFCPTLQVLDMYTICGSMSTEGETLQDSVLTYRCMIFQRFVGACQQKERQSKFLSYLAVAWYVYTLWEHVNGRKDTPSFCPTLQLLVMSTFCGSMSTGGETLHFSLLT